MPTPLRVADVVLDLVDMGLLAAMANAPPDAQPWDGTLPVSKVVIDDWSTWERRFGVSLVEPSFRLDGHSIARFSDGIRVVRSEAGDPRLADEGDYYILRNDELQYALEPALERWVRFLRAVDGVRTVDEILQNAGVADRDVWKHLEEAVEYDVLTVVRSVSLEAGER